jgi:hypothetical protein
VEVEQNLNRNQSTQGPNLFRKEIRRPSYCQVGVQELLPRRAFPMGDRRQAVTSEHVAHVAGASSVPELLELSGEPSVTPRVVFCGETNNQGFGVGCFAGTANLCWRVLEGPFLPFLTPIPSQERCGLRDGNGRGQAIFDSQTVLHENSAIGFG